MYNILKCDLYRFSKSKLFYSLAAFTAFIAASLTMMIHRNIRLGILITGSDGFMFKNIDDVIRAGIQYHKLLGIFVAILLSIFIGQEYQWKTWQHKWITSKSRSCIYLSKAVFSSVGSASIFLIYQTTVLVGSNQLRSILTIEYITMVICGLFIYAAFGAVICIISMLIKNGTASTIVCLCYVLFTELIMSGISNLGRFSVILQRVAEFIIKHSVYGMSAIVSSADFTAGYTIAIIINSLIIMVLSTAIGVIAFRKYEL